MNILKHQVKQRKKQNKDFKRLYKKAVSTIRRLKESKETKQKLITDLLECNNIEIIHFLGEITPKTEKEYIEYINKLLELESAAHEYQYKMVYECGGKIGSRVIDGLKCVVGGFGVLTENIRKHHAANDRLEALKNKIYNISEG